MVDPRIKGAKAETVVRDVLREKTKLQWERVPGSGALDPKHMLKGDLYIPNEKNVYSVEVKHYAEDHLTSSILTAKSPVLLEWWTQCVRQANQTNRKPLLIFKFNRSILFVAFDDPPQGIFNNIYIDVNENTFWVSSLEDWLKHEKPKFI